MQTPLARQVPLYAFCNATRQWQPITSEHATNSAGESSVATSRNPPAKRFTCMTYNVFSGILSKSVPHASHRTRHALDLLGRSKADVIALQEVSAGFEQSLRRERWLRQDWCLTSLQDYFETSSGPKNGTVAEKDGCILAFRKMLLGTASHASMSPLPGQQGKVLIMVQVAGNISFITSHFESLAASERTRLHQYEHLSNLTKGLPTCIVLADFNHSSYGELKTLVGPLKPPVSSNGLFTDSGLASTSTASSDPLRDNATFGELYPFFEGSRRKERRKPRRLDIVLTKGDNLKLVKQWTDGHKPIQIDKRDRMPQDSKSGKTTDFKTYKVKLRCQQGKGGNTYASDHVAVLATFEVT